MNKYKIALQLIMRPLWLWLPVAMVQNQYQQWPALWESPSNPPLQTLVSHQLLTAISWAKRDTRHPNTGTVETVASWEAASLRMCLEEGGQKRAGGRGAGKVGRKGGRNQEGGGLPIRFMWGQQWEACPGVWTFKREGWVRQKKSGLTSCSWCLCVESAREKGDVPFQQRQRKPKR